jgi:hypothetical protein
MMMIAALVRDNAQGGIQAMNGSKQSWQFMPDELFAGHVIFRHVQIMIQHPNSYAVNQSHP